MSQIKHIKKENPIFILRSSKKSMNLKDLHGNSAAPVIYYYISFADVVVISWFHAYWSFTSEPTIQEDDENYPIGELKINCRCMQLKQRTIIILYGGYHHNK